MIDKLNALIQKKHMLNSPFYQAWSKGELTQETLQTYAKEYYSHVKAFPTYISALHSRCEDLATRRSLLANLMDEEASAPNHLQLWKNFALALGVDEEELDHYAPSRATQALIDTFQTQCRTQPVSVGLAALYSYESQIPSICGTKIDGLKKWYGISNPSGYAYFTEHETLDVGHAKEEAQMLKELALPTEEEEILQGSEKILDALGTFLDSFLATCPCKVTLTEPKMYAQAQ